jgi:glycosyltransferase involved in cell wall biosynthesis
MLIDAFEMLYKKHPEWHLTIYGEGELRDMLTKYIAGKELSDVISLPGFAKDIHEIMANAYMYVSSSDYEGISNSMLEALGIGLPCVCTDCPVGGAAMSIKDGESGILTEVGDSKGLYEGMRRMIEDKSFALSVSKASRAINEELTLEKITNMWVETIK